MRHIILQTVEVTGVVSVILLAPNVLRAMKALGLIPSLRHKEYIKTARTRLARDGLIKLENGNAELTAKGEAVLRRLELINYRIKEPRRWDKKWRLLVFDIPEKKKKVREEIRRILRGIGFTRLQDSVWLYPYPCEEVVELLKAELGLDRELIYLIVDTFEGERTVASQFNLDKYLSKK